MATIKKRILIWAILLIFFVGTIGVLYIYYSFISPPTQNAYLTLRSGNVFLNNNPVYVNSQLRIGDVIRTEEGVATLIFGESIFATLASDTQVRIVSANQESATVFVEYGELWNYVTTVARSQKYTVQTAAFSASALSTQFLVSADELSVNVLRGTVLISDADQEILATNQAVYSVLDDLQVIPLQTRSEQYSAADTQLLQTLREKEFEKLWFVREYLKNTYNWTDSELKENLKKIDSGEWNIDEILAKSPFEPAQFQKIKEITNELKSLANSSN